MAERLAISVEASVEHPEGLEVTDALSQLIDAFVLLVASEPSTDIRWCITDVSMNSPLSLTAEAFATRPEIDAAPIARRQKAAAEANFAVLKTGYLPIAWSADPVIKKRSMAFVDRSANGIGYTALNLYPDDPEPIQRLPLTITKAVAQTVQTNEASSEKPVVAYKAQIGSVDGALMDAITHYGKPAFHFVERRTKQQLLCLVASDRVKNVVNHITVGDIWAGRRARVQGKIHYKPDGSIAKVDAYDVTPVYSADFDIGALSDRNVTGGLDVVDYLTKLREGTLG